MSEPSVVPNVSRAGQIMFVSLFLSRVLGIVRDQVMVWTFGRTEMTDAYRWAFQIPDMLFFLIAGGALSSAFIPVFSEYLHTDRKKEAWHIFSVVTTTMSLIVAAFIALAFVFTTPMSQWVAPGPQADAVREHIVSMSHILLPAQFAFFIGGLMFGALYAHQRFAVPGLGPNVYNIGIIFGALVISHFMVPGIYGMSWGALAGAVVGSFLIPLWAMRQVQPEFRPSLDLRHPGVKKVFRLMAPVVFGLSLPGVYGMIMQAFSSFFEHGTATAIELANRIMQAPLGVFGQSLAIAVFPALSQFFAQQKMESYRRQLSTTLRTVIFLTVPISVILVVLAPEIVALLFQYGAKFGQQDTEIVANCLRMFGIGVWAWCLHPVLMRAFFAIQQSFVPTLLGTATTALFFLITWALIRTSLGYLALPLASSVSAIFLVAVLSFTVQSRVGGLDLVEIGSTLVKSLLACIPLAVLLGAMAIGLPRGVGLSTNLWALVKVVGGGLAGVAIYSLVARKLKMPETQYVDRALSRLTRGSPPAKPEGG